MFKKSAFIKNACLLKIEKLELRKCTLNDYINSKRSKSKGFDFYEWCVGQIVMGRGIAIITRIAYITVLPKNINITVFYYHFIFISKGCRWL